MEKSHLGSSSLMSYIFVTLNNVVATRRKTRDRWTPVEEADKNTRLTRTQTKRQGEHGQSFRRSGGSFSAGNQISRPGHCRGLGVWILEVGPSIWMRATVLSDLSRWTGTFPSTVPIRVVDRVTIVKDSRTSKQKVNICAHFFH